MRTHGALDAEEAIVSEGGSVGLTATGDIVFRALVASGGGDIRVESDGTITMLATARLDTEAGAGEHGDSCRPVVCHGSGRGGGGARWRHHRGIGRRRGASQLRTSGDVTLYAAGAVLDANGGDVNVVASHAILIARSLGDIAAGLSLDTQVASITAAATVGDVFLREADGLTVRSIVAATGDVCLVSTRGDVIVGWMQASGSLCIDVSKGSILDDGFGWTRIVADQLTLKAAVGIGMLGHPTTAQLETSVRSLVVEAATGVVLVNWGHALLIDAVTLSADSASARIVHHGGNVLVEEIALPGSGTAVLLVSTRGAVLDGNGDASNVTAGGLSICAFLGIGNGHDQLETSVDRLALHSAAGGAYVLNDRSVELVGLWVPGCWGHVVAGDLAVAAMGTIVVSDSISSTGSGNIVLQAREDVLIRAPVTACGGSVRILAEGDLLADPWGRLSSAGDVLLIADSDGSGSGTIQFAADIFVGGGFATFQLSDQGGFFSGSLSGPGGLVKRGTGSLQLTATSQNSYLGATRIEAGTLIVDGTIGLCAPAGVVTISSMGTLSGNGTVNAPVQSDSLTARIVSTGNLRLGDGSAAGFDFAGTFVIGDGHVVEVRDADGAQLGVVTSIGHGAVLVARGGVEVSSGELLTGFGRVQGDVTILAGGEIAPGPGAGILTTGQLALQAARCSPWRSSGRLPAASTTSSA